MSKRDVRVGVVPGNWNRQERTYLVILEEMRRAAWDVASIKREAGVSSWTYDQERKLALEWALWELSQSRAALDAARGGGK